MANYEDADLVNSYTVSQLLIGDLILIFGKSEYVDKNGIKWKVISTGSIEDEGKGKDEGRGKDDWKNYKTSSYSHSCYKNYRRCYKLNKLYYLNERKFKEIKVSVCLNKGDVMSRIGTPTFTTISFYYGHDFRTRVFTLSGEPKDLSKYRTDKYEYP